MSYVAQQPAIPPTCPTCETPMVIMPTVQFRFADGSDEIVYDCEKCRRISTVTIDRGQTSWTTPLR